MIPPRSLLFLLVLATAALAQPAREILAWEELPALPDAEGFAGSYAGVSEGALLVAGGANFPDQKPWEGGGKVWHDSVFVLDDPASAWRVAGRLPRPAGYGLSLTAPEGVILIGGGDAQANFTDVFLVRRKDGQVAFDPLPPLPLPLVMHTGALLGRTVFVAGGLDRPEAPEAQCLFLALDLDHLAAGWVQLDPWPGPGRFLATGGALDGSFFLFGGARLVPAPDGRPQREWLRDAWRYTPGAGWKRLADLPAPVVAAPGPAPAIGPSHLVLIGGDDGSLVSHPPESHPGFPRRLLAYHTITDTWTPMGTLPFSLVTTPAVSWSGRIVVPGGEARPGVRSTAVWGAQPVRAAPSFGALNYTALSLYLAGVAGVGIWFMRRQQSTADYFRGGGRIPWWVAGLSIFATMLSSITFMAIPAKAFLTDWTFAIGNLAALALAPIVIAFYLPFYRRLNVTSAYEYLEHRFNPAVRLYASASFILFQTGRMAVVIFLPALALSAVLGMDLRLGILLIGVTCSVYTALGGIEAVVWTDAIQALVLLGAAALSLALIALRLDGSPTEWWAVASAQDKLRLVDWTWDLTTAGILVVVVGNLFSNLGPYTSDQAVVQRYLTTPDIPTAARAIRLNAWLAVAATVLFFAIGTALFLFYRQHPDALEPTLPNDSIFPLFIAQFLPPGIAGLVIAGVFAAAQSTASSSVNSVVTAVITDWVQRFRPTLTDRASLRLSQVLSLFAGLAGTGAALFVAGTGLRSLFDAYLGLLGLLSSGVAGVFALGIFTRRATGLGALTGVIAGSVLLLLAQRNTSLHFLLYGAIGFLGCFVTGWLASRILPGRPKDLTGLTWSTFRRSTD